MFGHKLLFTISEVANEHSKKPGIREERAKTGQSALIKFAFLI